MPGRRAAAAATFLALSAASLGSAFQFPASPFSLSTPAPSKRDAVVMHSYQEQLARAKAEKAARQGGQQQYMAPPEAYRPPSPPPPPPAQYQQQQPPPQQARPAAALPQETNEAVATLLSLLGERLGSGQPLGADKVHVFTLAAEAVIREARGGGVSAAPVQQYQQPPQQYTAPPPQQYQQAQQPQSSGPIAVVYEAPGFDYQGDEDAWELGSRTLSGPAPGFKAASAYQPATTGGFDEDFDDFEKYGLPQPVTRQKKSPFMETNKGTPFYVPEPVSSDEYRRIISQRVKDAQMKRRQEEKHVGMESANHYMEELNRQKRERLRLQAEQQSQQWQQGGQQGGQQRQS